MQSIERVLDVLEYFISTKESKGVVEASQEINLPASTTHRVVNALVKRGYLEQDADTKRYKLGKTAFGIAGTILGNNSLVQIARPFLIDLSNAVGETVHLCIMENFSTHLIERINCPQNISFSMNMGFRQEPGISSFGKVLLAYSGQQSIDKYLENATLVQYTKNTITDKNALREELRLIKKQGYAIDNEEIEIGLTCVGAPVFQFGQAAIAAISISGPTFRMQDGLEEKIKTVQSTARKLSNALGYVG